MNTRMTEVHALSPEAALRNDGSFRFERGGVVYATDGRVGFVRQVVVDVNAGMITALVVEVDKPKVTVLMPLQAVAKTGGAAVYLSGSRQQFTAWLEHAPRYNDQQVARANLKALLRRRPEAAVDPMRSIAQAGRDFIATGAPGQPQEDPGHAARRGKPERATGGAGDVDRRPFSVIGAGRNQDRHDGLEKAGADAAGARY